jgi:hypothetical protein
MSGAVLAAGAGGGEPFGRVATTLVFGSEMPDIADGRLAMDASLANRVRSGRKQP